MRPIDSKLEALGEKSSASSRDDVVSFFLLAEDGTTAQTEFGQAMRLKHRLRESLLLALRQEGKEEAALTEFDKAYEITPG
jgi:hypothetical protein